MRGMGPDTSDKSGLIEVPAIGQMDDACDKVPTPQAVT